jgi:hypothetical protein
LSAAIVSIAGVCVAIEISWCPFYAIRVIYLCRCSVKPLPADRVLELGSGPSLEVQLRRRGCARHNFFAGKRFVFRATYELVELGKLIDYPIGRRPGKTWYETWWEIWYEASQ